MNKTMRKTIALMIVIMFAFCASVCAEEAENDWQNILLLGGDSRSEDNYERTDSMIILSVNAAQGKVKMCSIMRDTLVEYPGLDRWGKINAAYVRGGLDVALATVNHAFDMDITDYVMINMHDMVELVDLFGGIDIEVTERERSQIKQLDHSGLVHLNGQQALSYSRIRMIDNDYHRVMRQQNVLLALAEKAQNMEFDDLLGMTDAVMEHIQTNLDVEQMKELALMGLSMEIKEISQYRIPADGTFESGMYENAWLIKPDFEENSRLLHEFIYENE